MGRLLQLIGGALWVFGGLWALGLCIGIVYDALGTIGAIAALFVLPATLGIAPWYEGFAHGNWFPLLLTYGSGIGGTILMSVGSVMGKDKE